MENIDREKDAEASVPTFLSILTFNKCQGASTEVILYVFLANIPHGATYLQHDAVGQNRAHVRLRIRFWNTFGLTFVVGF